MPSGQATRMRSAPWERHLLPSRLYGRPRTFTGVLPRPEGLGSRAEEVSGCSLHHRRSGIGRPRAASPCPAGRAYSVGSVDSIDGSPYAVKLSLLPICPSPLEPAGSGSAKARASFGYLA